MSMLAISLLGDFRLRDPDRGWIGFAGERGAQLLALLALPPGKKHRREVVQGLLWPEADQRHAQGNLRFTLHQVRKALGSDAKQILVGDSCSIWLDPSRVVVDVMRFESLVREGTVEAFTEACDLYRGDLLSTLLGVSSEYEDWLLPERERLNELAGSAFWQLFALRLWRGEVIAAKCCAQRFLEIDPYCERMHAALMRVHITQGERALAAQQYARLHKRLARDLQIRPSPDLEQLARSLEQRGGARQMQRFDASWVLGREGDATLDAKPLVAVLPFDDLSEGPPLIALPAALTGDVIGDLARFRRLAVLARHTSFALADHTDPRAWLRQLGVRYTIEGGVQRAGNRLRVTVRLVDSASLHVLWAERFHGDFEELPAFQEETTRAIVAAIPVQVEQAEMARVRHAEIHSLTAYELYLHGREQHRSSAPEVHAKAFEFFARALELDPSFAAAHCGLALSYFLGCRRTEGRDERLAAGRDERFKRAVYHAQQATELDPLDPQGHWVLGMLLQMLRDFGGARFHLDSATRLSPGDAETLAYTALEYAYAGDPLQAIGQATNSIRLNPCYPPAFAELMGKSCFIGRRYDEALFWLRQSPDRVTTNRGWLAATAAYAGRMDEAAMHARAMRATLRDLADEEDLRAVGGPIAWLRKSARFQNPTDLEHYEQGLAMAGLAS